MKANYKRQAAEQSIETLTHEILTDLVDHIKIYENGNISVHFKFTALFWTFISVGRITKVPSYLTVQSVSVSQTKFVKHLTKSFVPA